MHVTLAFLGRTPEERLPDVSAAATSAAGAVTAFDIELDHAGRFPETGVPQVLWLGIGAGAPSVLALGERLRMEIDRRQLERDRKPLRAHITLARVRENVAVADARKIAAAAEKIRMPHLRFRADHVVVFESVVSSKGPRYTPRATAALRVGGGS